ncbi:MAG: peptide chain release factor N(5)-glutamine methyltransferase [Epsilonproteobacteria bacterium]|nr:peptide chain release factor N(5)-glutamine methyltransferase [Campylobacterota bacterium]NPA63474.1 peptide chain release factor N(5)-glutamine methyltransferase [Campylobacterota bacterium]
MRIDEALRLGAKELGAVAQRPILEAQILLAYALGVDRVYLHSHADQQIEALGYFDLIKRRKAFEPIEYITNRVSFYGEEFFIESGVLIPRPETELLIDQLKMELRGDERVAEIGVGSGVISIMLKKLLGDLRITATDISQKALDVAAKNARLHGVHIDLVKADLLEGVDGVFDVIVSNPPYIQNGFPLDKNVALYEPAQALYGGEEGDEILRRIIDLFFACEASVLACEMGFDQRRRIEEYVGDRGSLRFYKDLAGLDRGFVLKKERR